MEARSRIVVEIKETLIYKERDGAVTATLKSRGID